MAETDRLGVTLVGVTCVVLLPWVLAGCSRVDRNAAPPPAVYERFEIVDDEWHGLSALCEQDGVLWAIPERGRVLLPLRPERDVYRAGPAVPIEGVPEQLDTESLACLADGRFFLGTESRSDGRGADLILNARLDRGVMQVDSSVELPYAPWRLHAATNEGIEGLCHAGETLLAVAETVIVEDGQRYAPLARWSADDSWEFYRLRLTSDQGKASAIACRASMPGRLELVVIERHFEISRLLWLEMEISPAGGDLQPAMMFDLAPEKDRLPPNFEGVEWEAGGRLLLVSDNQHGRVSGPSWIVRVPAPDEGGWRPLLP